MLTKMKTASLQGVNGYPVTVETDLHRGMPGFQIVGLADTTIKEALAGSDRRSLIPGTDFHGKR